MRHGSVPGGKGALSRPGFLRANVRIRWGLDLFIEDGAYTTLSAAVVMLVVLTLLFSSTAAIWSMSRAGDTQVAADSAALAGANVVSSYHTAATVVDASILSLGLAGFCTVGAGLVGLLVPGANAAAAESIDAGVRIIKTRNEFAKSASEGLEKLEGALPYLVAARATQAAAAQAGDTVSYTGTAVVVPRTSDSDFAALAGEEVSTDAIESTADELDRAAQELAKASEKTARAKERAWKEDCGSKERFGSMWERADRLAGLPSNENPYFESSVAWEPQVALDRTRAYYRARLAAERPDGPGTEAEARSAARRAFYEYAQKELEGAYIRVDEDGLDVSLPLIPRNVDEVRACELYTDAAWPAATSGGKTCLHYGTDCPVYQGGSPAGTASVADYDGREVCSSCRFSVDTLGMVPDPTTKVESGFEYHFAKFVETLEDYVDCRNRELELERQTEDEASRAGDAFDAAIKALSGARPRIAPPGRNGVVAFAVSGELESPGELDSSFNARVALGSRGAVSAAVLAPDAGTAQNNVLSRFFSTLEERSGGGVAGVLGDVMGLWGKLLVGYGDIQGKADELMDELVGDLGTGPLASIAAWLDNTVSAAVAGLGLEPCDLRLRKPVLTDTSNVIKSPGSDIAGLGEVQDRLRSIPLGATDPQDVADALGYQIERTLSGSVLTVAEIPLPNGESIPLTVDISTLAGAFEGGS